MISPRVLALNELLDEVRKGSLDSIEIIVKDKGKEKKIRIDNWESQVKDAVRKVQLESSDLSHVDFSKTKIKGDLSGMDLHESDFSNSSVEGSDISESNLKGSNFYNAFLSQTNLSGSYLGDMRKAVMTGSVDVYRSIIDSQFFSVDEGYDPYGEKEMQKNAAHYASGSSGGYSY